MASTKAFSSSSIHQPRSKGSCPDKALRRSESVWRLVRFLNTLTKKDTEKCKSGKAENSDPVNVKLDSRPLAGRGIDDIPPIGFPPTTERRAVRTVLSEARSGFVTKKNEKKQLPTV